MILHITLVVPSEVDMVKKLENIKDIEELKIFEVFFNVVYLHSRVFV